MADQPETTELDATHESIVSPEALRFKEDTSFPIGVLINSLLVILLFAIVALVIVRKYRDKALPFLEKLGLSSAGQKGPAKKRPQVESIRLSSKTVLHIVEHADHTIAVAESSNGVAIEKLDRHVKNSNTTDQSGENNVK